MRVLKFIVFASFFIILLFKGIALYTGNFSKEAVTNHFSVHGHAPHEPSKSIKKKLQQSFRYLSRGHQTYAFIGDDGKTVIKFFNFSQLELPLWISSLPSVGPIHHYKQRKKRGYQHRLERLFRGHEIAEASKGNLYGITYQHLDTSEEFFSEPLDIVDAIGLHHSIPLDEVVFVVQDKAEIAREEFSLLLARDDVEGVKRRIDQLFKLYQQEFRQQIMDKDPNVIDNVGFVGEKAIRIDVGRLRKTPSPQDRENLMVKVKQKFHRWVNKYFPGHEQEISEYLDIKVKELDSSLLHH